MAGGAGPMASDVRVRVRVTLTFESTAVARAVERATCVDNPARGTSERRSGRSVVFEARAKDGRSARETLDDWLRCATAAAESARRA